MKLNPMLNRQILIAVMIALLACSGAVQVTHPLVHIEKVHSVFIGHDHIHDYLPGHDHDHPHDHDKANHDHLCQECVLADFSLATSFLLILSVPHWLISSFEDTQYTRPSQQLIGEATIRGPPKLVVSKSE